MKQSETCVYRLIAVCLRQPGKFTHVQMDSEIIVLVSLVVGCFFWPNGSRSALMLVGI